MAARAVERLSWVVVPLALLGYGLYLALGLSGPVVNGLADFSLDDAVWVLGQAAFAIVGSVVASRRPELPIGWLFCAAGLCGLVAGIAAHTTRPTAGSFSPRRPLTCSCHACIATLLTRSSAAIGSGRVSR